MVSYDQEVLTAALPLMTRANPVLLSSETYYLAEIAEGRVVGCGGWTRTRLGCGEIEPGLAHIRHFATDPRSTGQGIGRATYTLCEEGARSALVRRFECYSSLNAVGFYAALGFKSLRALEIPMGPNLTFPGVLMERSI